MLEEARLAWQRSWIDQAYTKDISAARAGKDREKVEALERHHQFELELHDEEEDAHLTGLLQKQARRPRVPIPHRFNEDKTESDHWFGGAPHRSVVLNNSRHHGTARRNSSGSKGSS